MSDYRFYMKLYGFRKYRSYEGNQVAFFKPTEFTDNYEGRFWIVMGKDLELLPDILKNPVTYTKLTPGNIGFYEVPTFCEKIKHIIKIIRM